MNIDRIWTIGISGAILIVGVLGWLLGVSPVVAQASAADQQRASIFDSNQASEAKIEVLKKQFAHVGTLQTELDSLATSIPGESNLALFLREIDTLTNQYQVSLKDVSVSSAQKYVPAVVVAPVATGTTGTSTPTPTPSPSASAGATVPAPVVPAGPGARLLVVPVKISFSGSYENVMNLVGALQTGDRLYLVTDLVVKASSASGSSDFQADITGNVYALPSAAGAVVATSTVTHTPTPTPTATPTPNPTGSTAP
jgi:Tfp pilus assembly protein PilO